MNFDLHKQSDVSALNAFLQQRGVPPFVNKSIDLHGQRDREVQLIELLWEVLQCLRERNAPAENPAAENSLMTSSAKPTKATRNSTTGTATPTTR